MFTLGVTQIKYQGTGWVSTENSFSDVSHHVDIHLVQHSEFGAVDVEDHMQISNCHLGSTDEQSSTYYLMGYALDLICILLWLTKAVNIWDEQSSTYLMGYAHWI